MKHFYDTESGAKYVGCSTRHFARISKELRITALNFSSHNRASFKWTIEMLDKIKSYFEENKNGK